MKYAVLWACLAVVAACGPSTFPSKECGTTFAVSPAFSAEERVAIDRAMLRWNGIAEVRFCTRFSASKLPADYSEPILEKIEYGGEIWQKLAKDFHGNVYGVHLTIPERIYVVDSLDPATFEIVVLHELGHAHGLWHTDSPAIMHAKLDGTADFTSNDIAECERVGACNPSDVAAAGY